MITGIQFIGAGIITASAASLTPELDVRWAILTLAGAVMVSAMAWMLNEQEESKRRVFGRAIGAFIGGVLGSRLFWYFSDWARDSLQDPLIMMIAGAAFGLIGYVLAAALVSVLLKRSDRLVDHGLRRLGGIYMPDEPTPEDIAHAKTEEEKRKRRRNHE